MSHCVIWQRHSTQLLKVVLVGTVTVTLPSHPYVRGLHLTGEALLVVVVT